MGQKGQIYPFVTLQRFKYWFLLINNLAKQKAGKQ